MSTTHKQPQKSHEIPHWIAEFAKDCACASNANVANVVTATISETRAPNSATSQSSDPNPNDLESNVSKRGVPKLARILVVDDELVTRVMLKRSLETQHYEVELATNGREALESVYRGRFDLVIMDISMPDWDGLQTLHLIRMLYGQSELPVIMMTADSRPQQVVETFESGANDYISKPIDPSTARVRIQSQLKLKLAHDALLESEQRYALASAGTLDGIWDWNIQTGEVYFSERWRAMVGITDLMWEPHATNWLDYVYEEDRQRVRKDLEEHLCGETSHFESELRMPSRDGGFSWMLCRGLAVRDKNGIATRIAGSLTDITEGKVADALTGLPNRLLFHDRVSRSVEQYQRNPSKRFAVMYMDVDDFKLINDSFGHDVGDEFLIQLASRLESALQGSEAVLARLGGDEFAILLEDIQNVNEALRTAQKLQERVKVPFAIAGREILTKISIGITFIDADNASTEDLIRQADAAMYHAKSYSDAGQCIFDSKMLEDSATKLELGAELRFAIRRDEFQLLYQPIIHVAHQQTAGFEALMRWHHPVHGNIPPSDFIPIAESNGLIVEIGEWVLRQACRQIATWSESCLRPLMMSVNVSVRQLADPCFVDIVQRAIHDNSIDPTWLKLEITESMLMQNPKEMLPLLTTLHQLGVRTGIDDFGTGYSSLAYLHQMPLNVLKIDRSFVKDLQKSPKHKAIVRSIVALSRSLELAVIAEGIEIPEQANYLQSLECDYFQGYLFSKPVDAETAESLIHREWEY